LGKNLRNNDDILKARKKTWQRPELNSAKEESSGENSPGSPDYKGRNKRGNEYNGTLP